MNIKNPVEEFKSLAKYLEVELSDEKIIELIEFTSFKNMKSYIKFTDTPENRSPNFKESMEFFRKGQIGDWKNYFTDDMIKKLKEIVEKNLRYKGKMNYGED